MSWLRIFTDLSQQLNWLSDCILTQGLFETCYLHSCWDEDYESLKVVYEDTGLFPSVLVKVFIYLWPVKAVYMEEVHFMIEDEDWRVTILDLLTESMLLLEDLLETRVVVLNVPDWFSQADLEIVVVLELEDASFWNVCIFDQRLMDVLFWHKESEVDVQHDSCVGHKDVLHVEVFVRLVFVPDEIPNEPSNHKPISTQLLQEVAISLKHLIRHRSSSRHDILRSLRAILSRSTLKPRQISGLALTINARYLILFKQDSQSFPPIFINRNIDHRRVSSFVFRPIIGP